MNRAYLGLGSNIDPERNLQAAVELLSAHGARITASRVYETAPVGCTIPQPNYLNAAVLLETSLTAAVLRNQIIAGIENALHRVRDPMDKNAPRTIDIDIALFNRAVFELDHRRIPDPDILERAFLAVPLAELDPLYIHPETGETLRVIANRLSTTATMQPRHDIVLIAASR